MESWTINGHVVEFEEESHMYLVDGIECPSVTQILGVKYKNSYQHVQLERLKRAAELGTALHEAIERYEKTGETCEDIEFHNYLFLKRSKGFKNVANEIPILYEEDGQVLYVGRLDQVIEYEGKLCINDFKRIAAPNKEKIAYQVNLYRLAYEQSYHQKIERLFFTQLKEDKRKFVELPIKEEKAKELIRSFYKEKAKNANMDS